LWVYRQKTGQLFHADMLVAEGYSGFGEAKNDPLQQNRAGMGPIPQGAYAIGAESENMDHGPVALHLLPLPPTNAFGRSGFLVHGDSKDHPGAASHGCIIVPRPIRELMRDGHDKLLVVLSGVV
jgi:hypothetical protein